MHMVRTSDETQSQIFADWALPHAKRVTTDSRQSPEYHVVVHVAIRKLRTEKKLSSRKSWSNVVRERAADGI